MGCCSRSTLGIVIGILNIICYAAITVMAIVFLVKVEGVETKEYWQQMRLKETRITCIVLIVVCALMTVIAGLLVAGIVKRRHKLMMPWLILSGIGFICNCIRILFAFFGALFSGAAFSEVIIIFIVGVLLIGFSALILWPIYTLYGDIRKENIEGPVNIRPKKNLDYRTHNNYKL